MLTQLFGAKAKAVSAVIGEALTLAVAFWGTGNKWVALAVGVAAALGVYAVPNVKPKRKPKPAPVPAPAAVHADAAVTAELLPVPGGAI